MFGFSPFGKKGVPPREQAMAALGVDIKGSTGLKGDRGHKGPEDEIELSVAEQEEVKELEDQMSWNKERVVKWVRDQLFWENATENIARGWVENTFIFNRDGSITLHEDVDHEALDLQEYPQITTVPPIVCKSLLLGGTNIQRLPHGLEADYLDLTGTPLTELPEGLQVKEIELTDVEITHLPNNLGALERVGVGYNQDDLAAQFRARGIQVNQVTLAELLEMSGGSIHS